MLKTLALAAALAAAGCSSVTVTTDYDHSVDFVVMRTFAWAAPAADAPDPFRGNTIVKNRVRNAIQAELAAKSISLTDGKADFVVDVHGYSRDRVDVSNVGPGWRGISVQQYTEGTLIVDFVKPGTTDLLWRGVATSALDSTSGSVENIDETIHKLLASFPPPPATAPAKK